MPSSPRKRLVVIGAGFAGVNLVQRLYGLPLDIILVDRHNYHMFQPLLYQVATAALSPADIGYPIRRIFREQQNVRVVLGEVERIDLSERRVYGGEASVGFDYLAICVGATHSYFGKDEAWARLAPGLKNLDDATEIRRRILLAFEEAELEPDPEARRSKLTFVVVGGGPTGVEMAGALREIAAIDIQEDFRNIDTKTTRVILVQGGDRVLPSFDPKLSARAKRDLEAMGVEVRLDARVTDIDEAGVWIGDEQIRAQNVFWAAGVRAPKLLKTLGVEADRSGRVKVGPDLSVPGHPNVFVLGDCADATDAKTGKPIPGLAPAAMQMGKFVAKVIKAELKNGTPIDRRPAFSYWDKGTMATIGKRRAVAEVGKAKFAGLLAWLAWSLIHVALLISFRSRVFVMLGWMYDYFAKSREARLITGNFKLRLSRPPGSSPQAQPVTVTTPEAPSDSPTVKAVVADPNVEPAAAAATP